MQGIAFVSQDDEFTRKVYKRSSITLFPEKDLFHRKDVNGISGYSLIFLDVDSTERFPRDIISRLREFTGKNTPIFCISKNCNDGFTKELINAGASGVLMKHESVIEAIVSRDRVPEGQEDDLINDDLQYQRLDFIICDKEMKLLHEKIHRIAKRDSTILLIGETGTGKDHIAREIHKQSRRADKPFFDVGLNRFPESLIESELFGYEKGAFSGAERAKRGRLEAANGGTLYFPEISELPEHIQIKLLYFLQYKIIDRIGYDPKKSEIKLDVRLIFGTNIQPTEAIASGKLREDFYQRINVVNIRIPPLRERIDDIEPLALYFADLHGKRIFGISLQITRDALDLLKRYDWPGNIRELEHAIEKLISNLEITSDYRGDYSISQDDIKEALPELNTSRGETSYFEPVLNDSYPSYDRVKRDVKSKYFSGLLTFTGGDIRKTANISGLTPRQVRNIINELGIK